VALGLGVAACDGPSQSDLEQLRKVAREIDSALGLSLRAVPDSVRYAEGRCYIDGNPAGLAEVEARQAAVTERILARAPLLMLVTVLVIVLGGMTHLEKVLLLFSTRKEHAQGLGDRIRAMLDRYRVHPVRYFGLVSSALGLLLVAASLYIYLDTDRRQSERALAMLQFCHLALRTAEEQRVLDEQRRNLESIHSTALDIRSMVDKLPPEEQRKAREIVDQMNAALDKQGKLVGDYVQRSEESTQFVKEHALSVERGLSELGESMKSVPGGLHDLSESVQRLDAHVAALDQKLGASNAKLEAAAAELAKLESQCPRTPAPGLVRSATAAPATLLRGAVRPAAAKAPPRRRP
jgi:hypothetical protein